jgi:hypothetical protein
VLRRSTPGTGRRRREDEVRGRAPRFERPSHRESHADERADDRGDRHGDVDRAGGAVADGDRRAEARARGRAEQVRVGERVAEHGLVRGARGRQRRATRPATITSAAWSYISASVPTSPAVSEREPPGLFAAPTNGPDQDGATSTIGDLLRSPDQAFRRRGRAFRGVHHRRVEISPSGRPSAPLGDVLVQRHDPPGDCREPCHQAVGDGLRDWPQHFVSARKIRSGSASMMYSADSCG